MIIAEEKDTMRTQARRQRSRGQTSPEFVVVFVALTVALLAMRAPIRRAVAGYWFRTFHANQTSPYLPGDSTGGTSGHTSGATTLIVRQNRTDVFSAKQLTGQDGRSVLLSRITSDASEQTRRLRRERVTLRP